MINLGDYVLASKYRDCDPGDPWRVGFVVRIITTLSRSRSTTYIIGEADGTWSDFREYNYALKITPEAGKSWIRAHAPKQTPPVDPPLAPALAAVAAD